MKKKPKIVQLNLKVKKDTAKKFKEKCEREGLKMCATAEKLLRRWIIEKH